MWGPGAGRPLSARGPALGQGPSRCCPPTAHATPGLLAAPLSAPPPSLRPQSPGFPKSCEAWSRPGSPPRARRGEGALTAHLLCGPALCSWVLGNGHLLPRSGASGLSLGSLLFLPKGRGNYSSALASWLSPASGERGPGRGRRRPQVSPAGWRQHRRPEPGRAGSAGPRVGLSAHLSRGRRGPPCAHWGAPWSLGAAVPHGPSEGPGETLPGEQGDAHFPRGRKPLWGVDRGRAEGALRPWGGLGVRGCPSLSPRASATRDDMGTVPGTPGRRAAPGDPVP